MSKLLTGIALGFVLGASLTSAVAAGVFGGPGFMFGWHVVGEDGDVVCSDPYVWPVTREIECT